MRKVTRLSGVRVDTNKALPKLIISDDELRLASIPGFNTWLEPNQKFFNTETTSVRGRTDGVLFESRTDDSSRFHRLGTFSSGAPCFDRPAPGAHYIAREKTLNPDEWTVCTVVHFDGKTAPNEIVGPVDTVGEGECALRFGFNLGGSLRVWMGDTTPRISHESPDDYLNQDVYVMAAFSVKEGIRLFRNGTKVAEKASDKQPLTELSFQIGSAANDSSSGSLTGKMGHVFIFDTDLSLLGNQGHKDFLDNFMMSTYKIP